MHITYAVSAIVFFSVVIGARKARRATDYGVLALGFPLCHGSALSAALRARLSWKPRQTAGNPKLKRRGLFSSWSPRAVSPLFVPLPTSTSLLQTENATKTVNSPPVCGCEAEVERMNEAMLDRIRQRNPFYPACANDSHACCQYTAYPAYAVRSWMKARLRARGQPK